VPLAPAGFVEQLRAIAAEGVLPRWGDWFGRDVMSELIPDERLRAALVAEMPEMPLSYFEASVPLPKSWDKRPCAYLLLSGEAYAQSADDARDRGWPVGELSGAHHLAMATEPVKVTDALLELERELLGLT
jgi:hypothetical protein